MKKRFMVIIVIAGILLLLSGLYWFGYLTFQGYLPSFTTSPDTTSSDTTGEPQEETPRLTIERVKGRLNKIMVDIKNIGEQDARSINWSVTVKGGILKRIDHRSSGTITTLPQGSTATILTDRIPLGFGRLDITVTVETSNVNVVTQSATGFKLFFFVIGVRT